MEYMSKECYDELVAEVHQLINVDYPKVRDALTEAREKGDLSENFEYHAAKRELSRIMGRIRFKQRVLENARVLDTAARANDKVLLLSQVEIENLATHVTMTYTLVNPHEANRAENKISVQSPIGKALLGHKLGDTVEVQVPSGVQRFEIKKIS